MSKAETQKLTTIRAATPPFCRHACHVTLYTEFMVLGVPRSPFTVLVDKKCYEKNAVIESYFKTKF